MFRNGDERERDQGWKRMDALCEEPKEALIMTIELSRLDAINNLLQRVEYKHEMSILILSKLPPLTQVQ